MECNKNISEKDSREQIELHNREMTDLLGDPPAWLLRTGSYMIYGILTILILGSAFISYPDAVRGQVVIEDIANMDYVKANSSGLVETLMVKDGSTVKKGDTIGVIQNSARLDDVNEFCRILTKVEQYYRTDNADLLRSFPFDLIMGDMSGAYEIFTQAVRNSLLYNDYNNYAQRMAFLKKELDILRKDSEKNELAILKVERDRFELSAAHKTEMEKNRRQLELAYENMINSIRNWEASYLLRSRSEGRVVLGEERELMRLVNRGDTICSVIAGNKEVFEAKMHLAQEQVADIKPGNTVNISLAKYPAHTYGILEGEVASVAFIPYNKMYAIDIRFPNLLNTTARKKIDYEPGLKGEAEIITSSRSVLSRIFSPLYNIWKGHNKKTKNV